MSLGTEAELLEPEWLRNQIREEIESMADIYRYACLEIGGNKMDRPFFEPWIGGNYENGGLFGKKILALGDSHYCNSCEVFGVAGEYR